MVSLEAVTQRLKKRLWRRCFPVNFAKFLRTAFFIEHRRWLLLHLLLNTLSVNSKKRSNTLKQFVGTSRRIAWVCLAILWALRLKGYVYKSSQGYLKYNDFDITSTREYYILHISNNFKICIRLMEHPRSHKSINFNPPSIYATVHH